MVYIRHRDRMVQQSVYDDLRNTLIACRWMAGTTSRPVRDPATPRVFDAGTGTYSLPPKAVITTTPERILGLLGGVAVNLIDYFPEIEGEPGDRRRSARTPLNTFAMDNGQPADPTPAEMGSPRMEQEYAFNFAFYASSDAVALAVLNDLRDRYAGRIVAGDAIDLYDWVTDPDVVAVGMEVDAFHYARNEDVATSQDVHLYFAELMLTDFVDP